MKMELNIVENVLINAIIQTIQILIKEYIMEMIKYAKKIINTPIANYNYKCVSKCDLTSTYKF